MMLHTRCKKEVIVKSSNKIVKLPLPAILLDWSKSLAGADLVSFGERENLGYPEIVVFITWRFHLQSILTQLSMYVVCRYQVPIESLPEH
jgi:hypothetical protein